MRTDSFANGSMLLGTLIVSFLYLTLLFIPVATHAATIASNSVTPPIVVLRSNISSVQSGNTATLSWSVTGATSCTAKGSWSGSKAFSGTFVTQPITTLQTYRLSCTGAGGTTVRSVAVTVTSAVISAISPVKVAVLGASTAAGKNLVVSGYSLSDSWVNRYSTYLSSTRPGSSVLNLAVAGSANKRTSDICPSVTRPERKPSSTS